jgi:hypothetical protein
MGGAHFGDEATPSSNILAKCVEGLGIDAFEEMH